MEVFSLVLLICIALVLISDLVIRFLTFKKTKGADDSVLLKLDSYEKSFNKIESSVKDEIKTNRQELNSTLANFNTSIQDALHRISKSQLDQLKAMTDTNQQILKELNEQAKADSKFIRESLEKSFNDFQLTFEKKQDALITNTETKLEQMRVTVDEKLQKTLNERLGQSFELVRKQLEGVQKGLGEMQSLAQDVGGLKKVLSNVKMSGGLGEVRLEMLLEQVLAPEQYEANVKTKKGSSDLVEFAIKLPGKDDDNGTVYLPIDAKFPQDIYHQLMDAYEKGEPEAIDAASKVLANTIKKMARDIKDKYIDPPNTTDFGIMFLPFEGLYAEVTKHAELFMQLQRDSKIIVAGPTTLAAFLNSLHMGFKTLAIQKRSSEVWKVLGAVKTEFETFGGLLKKAQNNLHTATNNIDELIGKRTKAIQRKLRDVESLPQGETVKILPELGEYIVGEADHIENESE